MSSDFENISFLSKVEYETLFHVFVISYGKFFSVDLSLYSTATQNYWRWCQLEFLLRGAHPT